MQLLIQLSQQIFRETYIMIKCSIKCSSVFSLSGSKVKLVKFSYLEIHRLSLRFLMICLVLLLSITKFYFVQVRTSGTERIIRES